MARYQLAQEDVRFAHEFLRQPFGYRSPGLQRVLNVMRGQGPEGKYVVICKDPYRLWQLACLPAKRGEAIREIPGITYTSLALAECDVFMRRWRDLGGPEIGATFNSPNPRA